MYESFTGEITRHRPTELVLEVSGIAYKFAVPLSTSERIPRKGRARLLTHLVVREDKLDLIGFSSEEERRLFRMLIAVSGIGPAVALGVLSRASVSEFVRAVRDEDRPFLHNIKGVGKKTADRILVELQDPVHKWDFEPTASPAHPAPSPQFDEAVTALGTLGMTPLAARKAVERAFKEMGEDAALGAVVRSALAGT